MEKKNRLIYMETRNKKINRIIKTKKQPSGLVIRFNRKCVNFPTLHREEAYDVSLVMLR